MVDVRKKRPLEENENLVRRSNQEQGMYQAIKRWKLVEIHPTALCVEARSEACGEPSTGKRELYAQVRNSTVPHYHPPKRKQKFQSTVTMAWNGCSETTGGP